MSELLFEQPPLTGFEEQVEPVKILEIGCGVTSRGTPFNTMTGRIYDLPHVYNGIEREEAFALSTKYKTDETEKEEARLKAIESGIVFGNVADLPFEDDSIDVITMRSVFGQFTGNDFREIDNVRFLGLMEAFRVLRPNGIIAISEENTPWNEEYVFHYLNNVGFTVVDYSAMRRDWEAPDKRATYGRYGRAVGEYRNVYAPENEKWLNDLRRFYGYDSQTRMLSSPRQYLMVGQKQQPTSVEHADEWHEWTVAKDYFDNSDSKRTSKQKVYKCGQQVEQDYLDGMYAQSRQNRNGQQELFYMLPRRFF